MRVSAAMWNMFICCEFLQVQMDFRNLTSKSVSSSGFMQGEVTAAMDLVCIAE